MPERALGAPRGVGVFDEPSAGHRQGHERGESKAGDERRADELMVERAGVVAEEIADGAEREGPNRRAGEIVRREAARIHP